VISDKGFTPRAHSTQRGVSAERRVKTEPDEAHQHRHRNQRGRDVESVQVERQWKRRAALRTAAYRSGPPGALISNRRRTNPKKRRDDEPSLPQHDCEDEQELSPHRFSHDATSSLGGAICDRRSGSPYSRSCSRFRFSSLEPITSRESKNCCNSSKRPAHS
jgi:hypothetical protein